MLQLQEILLQQLELAVGHPNQKLDCDLEDLFPQGQLICLKVNDHFGQDHLPDLSQLAIRLLDHLLAFL